MRYGMHLNKSKVFICLLAYFIGWVESANALPLLFVVLDDSHKAIVTENQGQFHLTVHHRGNGDNHEHTQRATAIITSGTCEQSDHELSVCGGEQLLSPATKIVKAVKDIMPWGQTQVTTVKAPSKSVFTDFPTQSNHLYPVHSAVLRI